MRHEICFVETRSFLHKNRLLERDYDRIDVIPEKNLFSSRIFEKTAFPFDLPYQEGPGMYIWNDIINKITIKQSKVISDLVL